jgi:hypothetical protein
MRRMYDIPVLPLPRLLPALLLLAALAVTPTCGRKGPPEPPIKVQPQGSAGFTSTQHGSNIALSWTLPEKNTDGTDLVGVAKVELFRYTELLKPKKDGEEEEAFTNYDVLDQVTQSFLSETSADDMYGSGYGTGAMAGSGEGLGGTYGGDGQSNTGMLGGGSSESSSRSGRGSDEDGWAQQQQQRAPRVTPGFRGVSGKFISAHKFEKKAELVHTLTGSQLKELKTSHRLYHSDPLPEMDKETLELTRYHYAVRILDTAEREGLFSEFLLVTPLEPPTPPTSLVAKSLEKSIDLIWDGPPVDPWVRIAKEQQEEALGLAGDEIEPGTPVDPGDREAAGGKAASSRADGEGESRVGGPPEDAVVPGWIIQPPATFGPESDVRLTALWPDPWPVGPRRPVPPYIAGYYVFRQREEDEGPPPLPSHGQPLIDRSFSDLQFSFGETYSYTVRTVLVTEDGRVESESSLPVTVTAVDVYAPITPVNFSYVAADGEVTLFWTPNGEPDLLGYNIYRHRGSTEAAEGEAVQLNDEPLDEPRFKDATVLPGSWYTYRVDAVDRSEPVNRSEKSEALLVMAR